MEKSMEWKFWHRSGPRRIPEQVRQALVSRFHLEPRTIDHLRLVGKRGRLSLLTGVTADSRLVRFIRVFDPSLVEPSRVAELTYDHFETTGYRRALLFEGHIEPDGAVHLADRRSPRISFKPKSSNPPRQTEMREQLAGSRK